MTLDELCRAIVAAWPEWEADAGQEAQIEQDSRVYGERLRVLLKAKLEEWARANAADVREACAKVARAECVCQGHKVAKQIREQT